MSQTTLITESLSLMVIGMGTVFSFLLLLVVCLRGMSWLAGKLAQDTAGEALAPTQVSGSGHSADTELIAAISAAVARYRSQRRP